MKDNGKELPTNKKNIKYSYGRYIKTNFCKKCREFYIESLFVFAEDFCPSCGSEKYERIIGRYKYETKKLGFSVCSKYEKKIIGFLPKIDEV